MIRAWFGWQRVWRILLIGSAAAVVLLSAAKLTLDLTQPGPHIYPGQSPSANPFSTNVPGVPETAIVQISLLGLDTANNTIKARLAVTVDQALAEHIRLMNGSALDASDSSQWTNLSATLELVNCIVPACIFQYSVQIPLGDLLPPDTSAPIPTFRSTIDIPDDANPATYPSDRYIINIFPQLTFPASIIMSKNSDFSILGNGVTTSTTLTKGGGIADKNVELLASPGGQLIVISRPGLDQSLIYSISVIPAVLGFLVFWLILRGRKRVAGSDSGVAAIVGLLAAWLTILPLRPVLVPMELSSTPLTRVDDILIFDAAVVFLFLALAFAMIRPLPVSEAVGIGVDASSLYSVKIPPSAPLFISHAVRSFDDTLPENRRGAIATLAAARTADANFVLREALKHPIPDVRCAAAKALQEIGDPAAAPALIEALIDDDKNVRSAAARALGEMKTSEAVPHLKKLRSDPDKEVRSAARRALRIIRQNSHTIH